MELLAKFRFQKEIMLLGLRENSQKLKPKMMELTFYKLVASICLYNFSSSTFF